MNANAPKTTHIGRNIACLRRVKGIKQSAFAAALGITQQAVSKMEQSEGISYSRLLHVANVLGVSPDTIQSFNDTIAGLV